MTHRERMIYAYTGSASDSIPAAPEFWYYYPARLLGVNMIELEKEIPHHQALMHSFKMFDCEGWGIISLACRNEDARCKSYDSFCDEGRTLEERSVINFRSREFESLRIYDMENPSWLVSRYIKDFREDAQLWADYELGKDPASIDTSAVNRALEEVGESFLLEGYLGMPMFDLYADAREGGFEQAVFDLMEPDNESFFKDLQQRYIEYLSRLVAVVSERTQIESFFLGCNYSCVSLLGKPLWNRWDKPVIKAVAEAVHSQGKLLHIHFHGKCIQVIEDLEECGIDCICPFERGPGGDIHTDEDLHHVFRQLGNRTTFNGNIHTTDTLLYGTEKAIRDQVDQVIDCAAEAHRLDRLIVGTGDQVAKDTPYEHIHIMLDQVRIRSGELINNDQCRDQGE